jgi:hypothetical protein
MQDRVQIQDAAGEVLHCLNPGKWEAVRVISLAFSPDGRRLAIGYYETEPRKENRRLDTVRVWDVATGKLVRGLRPTGGGAWLQLLAFSPDGKTLATVERGMPPQLFDVATGRELCRLLGYHGTRDRDRQTHQTIAFSPDGTLVATNAGKNDGIVLWEAASGKAVRLLAGHDGGTRSLAFSPDGRKLLSGGADSTALVWAVSPRGGESVKRGAWTKETPARLWDDLAKDPEVAYPALWSLLANPDAAVALLEKRLKPDEKSDPKRIERLIADLGDDDFEVRQKADADLRKLGERAETALRRALETAKDLEVRKRAAGLLARLEAPPTGDQLRERRAIHALEAIATPKAEALLRALAKGGEGRKTAAAALALERMAARQQKK